MDIRQNTRVPVQCPCDFLGDHVIGEGTVVNLSFSGCAVESPTRVPVGSYLEIRILIPEHFFPASIDKAVVLWSTDCRFGMKFIRLRPEEQSRLGRVLKLEPKHRNGSTAAQLLLGPNHPVSDPGRACSPTIFFAEWDIKRPHAASWRFFWS